MQPGQITGTAWTANIEDYAHLRGADRVSWAWEFLRRNPGYRRDFEAIKHWLPLPTMYDSGVVVRQLPGTLRRSFLSGPACRLRHHHGGRLSGSAGLQRPQ